MLTTQDGRGVGGGGGERGSQYSTGRWVAYFCDHGFVSFAKFS